jgi:hypothetical protein
MERLQLTLVGAVVRLTEQAAHTQELAVLAVVVRVEQY